MHQFLKQEGKILIQRKTKLDILWFHAHKYFFKFAFIKQETIKHASKYFL